MAGISDQDRALEVMREDGYDELDKKIDTILGRIGTAIKRIFIVGFVLWICFGVIAPRWSEWGEIILTIVGFIAYMIFILFMAIFQFVAIFWFLGRPRIYWTMPGETGVGFKDYKGNPEILESARQVVTLVRGVKKFKQMGGQPIRGLLLEGPPGTGKSYLGQAISTEAGVPFGYMSAPSIMGMFWGMDMLRVMGLYNKARKLARKYGACILFIDEIDAIAKSRTGTAAGGGMGFMGMMGGGAGALNELLNQMDPLPRDSWKDRLLRWFGLRRGRSEQPPVLTIAATNIVSILDPALLRPGRFDRQLRVGAPSFEGRQEVLEYYLSKVKHEDLPLDQMVAETVNYTPAQIKHLVNEAVVHAVWNGRDAINFEDFRWAMETYEWGMRIPVAGMSYADKRRLAYHEAGHAVAAVKLLKRSKVTRATIEARHDIGAEALVAYKFTEEVHTQTKEELVAQIKISLASRAAEQLFLGKEEEMAGASGDLANATRIANYMVNYLGMNGSLVSAGGLGSGGLFGAPASPASTKDIERLLDQQFKRVKQLLEDHREAMIAVAEGLIEKHALMGEEVYQLVEEADKRSLARVQANGHYRNGTNGHVLAQPDGAGQLTLRAGDERIGPG